MERAAPVRSSHTSTADLLAWPQPQGPAPATPSPPRRPGQPSEAIRKVVFGGQVTEEEADSLTKRKPCSAPKWKEMTGSGIFAAGSNGDAGEAAAAAKPARTSSRQVLRLAKPLGTTVLSDSGWASVFCIVMWPTCTVVASSTVSHISFAEDGTDPPKKPTSVAEVAKQRELSGTLQSETDSKTKKQISNAKSKELSGHDIFADTLDSRSNRARNPSNGSTASHAPAKNTNVFAAATNLVPLFPFCCPECYSTNVRLKQQASTFSFGDANTDSTPKTARKITGKKVNDLTGNDIFKGDVPPASAEKHLSTAKLKEITGSNIFADGKEPIRERVGGNRKPPGGESSIALI
ncbi:hypothetical protein ZEAMMB73_Zm00001d029376 [Zea mays]|uniref:DUF4057 domain-containing protein n=1 Tax=Zea mays TaxID=4577 RepID=A0A1D6K4Q7_MAIZE|nr:hypothetical protein ZEAMMB73_Zm00001d029376 [Zea mays]